MTALGLLKIYCIVGFILYVVGLVLTFIGSQGSMSTIGFLCLDIFNSAIIVLVMYGLGWGFLIGAKWILLQFGVVAANDIVYVVIYIILNILIGLSSKVKRISN